jgi:hypothetical protein
VPGDTADAVSPVALSVVLVAVVNVIDVFVVAAVTNHEPLYVLTLALDIVMVSFAAALHVVHSNTAEADAVRDSAVIPLIVRAVPATAPTIVLLRMLFVRLSSTSSPLPEPIRATLLPN